MGRPLPSLAARRAPLAAPAAQLAALAAVPLERELEDALSAAGLWPLLAAGLDVLQVNVGRVCNQTCRHCHVDAGPDRTESMSRETFEHCLAALERTGISTVDITGGAPELNPHFRWFVEACRGLGRHVIDRCNLTILLTAPHRDLPGFLAANQVEVVCSLPDRRPAGTDRQRGDGVFEASLEGLRRLNAVGYGAGTGLRLVLVTNPVGALLPGPQRELEAEWKRALEAEHGVRFDALYTITNMPIARYLEWLAASGNLDAYLRRLARAFNPAAAARVMCRTLVSVGWDGTLYDCDFNQMLELPLEGPRHVRDLDLAALERRRIATGRHCFGCTAGDGSSCGGATT
ncbi:MAG: arsenosugar biosynthesis radical SAM protein ArsS [Planctomycetes bacterium]|nr:arsenosugar biosynthesis radical SAM protein ArsS [Planctomycetota bacterium]